MERAETEVLRTERERILSLLAERGVREMRVFGSLARGDEDPRSMQTRNALCNSVDATDASTVTLTATAAS